MRCWLEFIHTPTIDAAGTLCFLHFDDQRYLLGNLSEGTSRTILQQSVSLRRVSDILLSGRTEWENIGGLVGTILNLGAIKEGSIESRALQLPVGQKRTAVRDQKGPPLRLHGPPNLNFALATTRRFVFRQGLPIQAKEYVAAPVVDVAKPSWSDPFIKVWALPVVPFEDDLEIPNPDEEQTLAAQDIVNKMFNSDWKLDKFVPVRLVDVQPPTVPFIRDPVSKQYKKYDGPMPGAVETVPDIEVMIREPWPAATVGALKPTVPRKESLSYIIRNHPQRGKFLTEKAKELQVKPGPDFGMLARGHSVENVNGKVITPDMVLEPDTPGTGFAFIDIPSNEYIAATLARPEWKCEQIMDGIAAIVWSLAPGVADDARLLQFQADFPRIQHIISAPDKSPDDLVLEQAVKQDIRNHRLAPESFPMIQSDPRKPAVIPSFEVPGKLSIRRGGRNATNKGVPLSELPKLAQRGLKLSLEPRVEFEVDRLTPPYDAAFMMNEVDGDSRGLGFSYPFTPSVVDPDIQAEWSKNVPWANAEVLCLGTGSSHPGTYRNVSSSLVRVPGDGTYMLDAGEGTLGTLRRMYPPVELRELLQDLRMIWISHLHADHHLGITSIIKAWYEAVHNGEPESSSDARTRPTLTVVSDVHMLDWLHEYSHVEDFGFSRIICAATVDHRLGGLSLYSGPLPNTSEKASMSPPSRECPLNDQSRLLAPEIRAVMSVRYINSCFVNHCHGAQAMCFNTRSGLKVSYSGDCRPSYKFADIGKGSHVLIHEATFEEDMRNEALAKKHSTAGEALLVAARMEAKSVVLTHFSQRYPKMANLNASSSKITPTIALDTLVERKAQSPPRAQSPGRRPPSRSGPSPDSDYNALIATTGSLRPLLAANPQMRVVMAFDYMRLKLGNLPLLEAQQPRMQALYDALAAVEQKNDSGSDPEGDTSAAQQPKGVKKSQKSAKHAKRQGDSTRDSAGQKEGQKASSSRQQSRSPSRQDKRARTDSGEEKSG